MSRAAGLVSLTLVLLSLAAAGCGGEDENLPSDIGGVCREVADRFAELQSRRPASYEQAGATVEGLLEIARGGDDALAELSDEAPDPDAYAAYLEARAGVARRLENALQAIRDERPSAYDAAREAANSGAAKRRRLAREAGLDECARSTGL